MKQFIILTSIIICLMPFSTSPKSPFQASDSRFPPHFQLISFLATLSQSAPAAVTKYHGLGGLNCRHLFLTVPKAGRLRSGQVVRRAVLGLQVAAFPWILRCWRKRALFLMSSYEGTNPIMKSPPLTSSKPNYLSKDPPPQNCHLGCQTFSP